MSLVTLPLVTPNPNCGFPPKQFSPGSLQRPPASPCLCSAPRVRVLPADAPPSARVGRPPAGLTGLLSGAMPPAQPPAHLAPPRSHERRGWPQGPGACCPGGRVQPVALPESRGCSAPTAPTPGPYPHHPPHTGLPSPPARELQAAGTCACRRGCPGPSASPRSWSTLVQHVGFEDGVAGASEKGLSRGKVRRDEDDRFPRPVPPGLEFGAALAPPASKLAAAAGNTSREACLGLVRYCPRRVCAVVC